MTEYQLPELVLVEDEIADELLSVRGIEKSGGECQITVKRDGASAIEYLLQPDRKVPALVVLDFNMPLKNGLEILQAVRADERTKLMPIIIFSGDHSREVVIECYRHGTNGWVKKPLEPNEYIEAMSRLVKFWLTAGAQKDRK